MTQQWKYFVATLERGVICWHTGVGEMTFQLEEGLGHLGLGGWELVATLDKSASKLRDRHTLIFKKPTSDKTV